MVSIRSLKRHLMRIIRICLFLLITGFSVSAQETDSSNSDIQIREFDEVKLSDYRQDRSFQYELPTPETEGPFQRFWRGVQEWFANLIGSGTTAAVFDIFIRVLIVVIFIYFIIKIFGIEVTTVFKPSKARFLLLNGSNR